MQCRAWLSMWVLGIGIRVLAPVTSILLTESVPQALHIHFQGAKQDSKKKDRCELLVTRMHNSRKVPSLSESLEVPTSHSLQGHSRMGTHTHTHTASPHPWLHCHCPCSCGWKHIAVFLPQCLCIDCPLSLDFLPPFATRWEVKKKKKQTNLLLS